jgi:DNA-binding response OmpR family regulator
LDIGTAKLNILLIDDDPLQLQIRQAVLFDAGFLLRTASSADQALSLLSSNELADIDLIITDHVLCDGTGVDFVRQLRTLKPDVPVVVVSGMPEAEDEYHGLNVSFRQKPCPAPQLIALVQELGNQEPDGK